MVYCKLVNRHHHSAASIFRAESKPQHKKNYGYGEMSRHNRAISKSTRNSGSKEDQNSLGKAGNFADWLS
jgi:hypothetical protein